MTTNKITTPSYVDLKSLHIREFFSININKPIIVRYGYINTDFGIAFVGVTDDKLSSLEFMEGIPTWNGIEYIRDDEAIISLLRQPSINVLLIGTTFQIKVWRALISINFGEVISYSKLAALMGHPSATRAVASAVARNKIGYFVPCHRVIRSNGDFGQFRWQASRKIEMLKYESENFAKQ